MIVTHKAPVSKARTLLRLFNILLQVYCKHFKMSVTHIKTAMRVRNGEDYFDLFHMFPPGGVRLEVSMCENPSAATIGRAATFLGAYCVAVERMGLANVSFQSQDSRLMDARAAQQWGEWALEQLKLHEEFDVATLKL